MAKVLIVCRIFPKGLDVSKVKKDINEKFKPEKIEEEPIAFGLKALKVYKIVEEEVGSKFEDELKKIDGVSQVEVLKVSRIVE